MPPDVVSHLRLNQAISKTGLCSRRQADELIRAGRVQVNGRKVLDFSFLVEAEKDELAVDGKPLSIKHFVYLVMCKPKGIVSTCSDELGRENILDLLPEKYRHLRPVGRLDKDTEGLIVFTNDGTLTQKLTHPLHHLPKTYRVLVNGHPSKQDLALLATGILLDDYKTQPAKVKVLKTSQKETLLELVIFEGKNRQIRRMFAYLGVPVISLARTAIGALQLGHMQPGSWRVLSRSEIETLESNVT